MRDNETDSGESVLLNISELERLGRFLDRFCESTGMPEEICYQLHVALGELVINTIKHGGCEPRGVIHSIRKNLFKTGTEP